MADEADFSQLCLLAFALSRRRRDLSLVAKGGNGAGEAAERLAYAVVAHVGRCGWDFIGERRGAALVALLAALVLAGDKAVLTDFARPHPLKGDCGVNIARSLLAGLRGMGIDIEKLQPPIDAPSIPRNIHSADPSRRPLKGP